MTVLWKKLLMIGLTAILSTNIWAAELTEDVSETPAPALRTLPQFTLDQDIADEMRDYTEKAIDFYKRLSGFSENRTWPDTLSLLHEIGNFLGDRLSLKERDHECFAACLKVPLLYSMESYSFSRRIRDTAYSQPSMDFRLRDIFVSISLGHGCSDVYIHPSDDYSELDDKTFDPAPHYIPLRDTIFIDALTNSPDLFDYFLYNLIDIELSKVYPKIKENMVKYYEELGTCPRSAVAEYFPMKATLNVFFETFGSSLRKLFFDRITQSANRLERLKLLEEVVNSTEIDQYLRVEEAKELLWTRSIFASWPHPRKGNEE